MEYDLQGNRTKLTDPDAGIIETKYNGFGELVEERQKVHNAGTWITTTNNYAPATGLLTSIVRNGETTSYTYDSSLGYAGRIRSIQIAGQHKQTFYYDGFSRVTNVKEEIDGRTYNRGTEYDALGRVKKDIYPSGYYTRNHYDSNGYLTKVTDKENRNISEMLEENARGQLKQGKKGNNTVWYDYDSRGFPDRIYDDYGIIDLEYDFNNKGNLAYREDYITGQYEDLGYDTQNRLTQWNSASIVYNQTTGNITTKSDIGNYTLNYGEENGKPHALTSISGVPANFPVNSLAVTYTDFKKIRTLAEGSKNYSLTYGVDDQRRKSVYKENNVTRLTRYYLGDYEEEISPNGNVRRIHYLSGAVLIQNSTGGPDSLLYVYTDYQGSIIALANESGTVIQRYAYDPWGKRKNPDNWNVADARTNFIINRGYTGHEHLDRFGIINMNGRVYDPLTAMFFSPDPFVIYPNNWLNYNRYLYGLGNPFKYVDPDGNNPFVIAALVLLGGYLGGVATNQGELNPIEWDYRNPGTYLGIGVGMFMGYAGGYWMFNPSALSVGLGLSIETPYLSGAVGIGGITTTGGMSDWDFHWSTSAGGGGEIPLGERKPVEIPVPEKPNSDSRFFQGDYYEASQLLSYVSQQDGVERIMYETQFGYYFEPANGYVFADLSKSKISQTNNTYWGVRENGTSIYYVQSTINGTYPFNIEQKGNNLYLSLGLANRYRISGVYHTHPRNSMLSLDDAFQNMNGIRVKAIGWDGYSRGSYFDNNTYYINEVIIQP